MVLVMCEADGKNASLLTICMYSLLLLNSEGRLNILQESVETSSSISTFNRCRLTIHYDLKTNKLSTNPLLELELVERSAKDARRKSEFCIRDLLLNAEAPSNNEGTLSFTLTLTTSSKQCTF